ncbi:uncharacterized protein TNCV_4093571 [Trichonephila clavipes]|nr:uncharacterized protein TNCV_4093571 [Trichonephila clavipes]
MINGRTRLHVVANGTMTGQRYIDEVLLPHDRLFRGAVGDKFVFMDDNTTCHRTLAVQDCLDSEGIQRLVCMASAFSRSHPIENVWDALGWQVAGRNYPPTNKNTLIHALTEEWDKLPQQLLDNVVQSMAILTRGMLHHTPRWTYPVLIPFFKVPADFLDALFHFSVRRSNEHFFFFQMFHSFCTFQNNKYSLF